MMDRQGQYERHCTLEYKCYRVTTVDVRECTNAARDSR